MGSSREMSADSSPGRFSGVVRSTLFAPLWADVRLTGVFLDLDGVLAPIAPRPDLAVVPATTVVLLRRLLRVFGLVAIVSGRSVADARRMIDLPGLTVVGNHGAEVSFPGQAQASAAVPCEGPRDERLDLIERVAHELESDERLSTAGVRLERKGLSVALHTRGSGEQAAGLAMAAAGAAAARYGLEVLRGRAVIDLRIPGCTKGSAVTDLVGGADLVAALYVGDDGTDLDAFAALDRLHGEAGVHGVKVGVASDDGPPDLSEAADMMIEGADVPALLAALADEAESRGDDSGAEEAR